MQYVALILAFYVVRQIVFVAGDREGEMSILLLFASLGAYCFMKVTGMRREVSLVVFSVMLSDALSPLVEGSLMRYLCASVALAHLIIIAVRVVRYHQLGEADKANYGRKLTVY